MAARALTGIRVIECGGMVAAAYATKLLADLGADVIKIEPPEGDPARHRGPFPGGVAHPETSGLFLYLNANKRGLTLDLRHPSGRVALSKLTATADLLIHNFTPPLMDELSLSYDEIGAANPNLIMTSITPFGLSGPRRDEAATDLTLWNSSGIANLNGGGPEAVDLPPLKPFGQQAEFQGGLNAAVASMGALFARLRGAGGQHVSVSIQESLATILELTFEYWPYMGLIASRLGRKPIHPLDFFECRDGWIFVCCVEEHQWKAFVELMDNPEWAAMELFETRLTRAENWDALKPMIQEWIAERSVYDLYRQGQARRIPLAPVSTMGDLFSSAHLQRRGFFASIEHPAAGRVSYPGAPYKMSVTPWELQRPAPTLGQHTDEVLREVGVADDDLVELRSQGVAEQMDMPEPLAGIRVADFTWVWAGPFCTLQLAHLGADVVRVETQSRPCVTRSLPPWLDGKPGVNRSGYFNQYNQGKRSLALDLKQPGATEIAKKLVAASDIVCENFATGVMDRLGLGYEVLRQINPRIIMIALSGYGTGGPESEFVSYGPAQVPLSGLSSLTGYAGWPPMHVGISYGDPTGGLHGAFAVLAALVHREKTGEGQFIDLSQMETMIALLPEATTEYAMNGTQPERAGNRDPFMAPHGVFRCAGHQSWVSLSVRDDAEWRRLALLIGGLELADDSRFATTVARKQNEDTIEEIVTNWTSERSAKQAHATLQAEGIPAFATFNSRDLAEDPHLRQSGLFVELDHPEVGRRTHIGIPWHMSGTPTEVRRPAPCLGADTDDVMADLGYSIAEIRRLKNEKILY